VIAVTDAGMKFALAHRAELFPDAAVVFGAASRPADADRMAGGGVTGVFVGNAYAATMKLALDLHPSTRRVFVIANASSQVSAGAVVRDTLRPFTQQIPLTYLEQRPLTELLAAVKAIPPDSVVLYVWHG